GPVAAAQPEGQRSCDGAADHQRAERYLHDVFSHAHEFQAHEREQDDRRPFHDARRQGGLARTANQTLEQTGDQEAHDDDGGAEQHATAQLQDAIENGGELWKAEHACRRNGEKEDDGDLRDACDDSRHGDAFGKDLRGAHRAIRAEPGEDFLEYLYNEARYQIADAEQQRRTDDSRNRVQNQSQHIARRRRNALQTERIEREDRNRDDDQHIHDDADGLADLRIAGQRLGAAAIHPFVERDGLQTRDGDVADDPRHHGADEEDQPCTDQPRDEVH